MDKCYKERSRVLREVILGNLISTEKGFHGKCISVSIATNERKFNMIEDCMRLELISQLKEVWRLVVQR